MVQSQSYIFKPASPTMEKKYYQSLEDLRDDVIKVTEVQVDTDDVESNLSK